MNQSTRQREDHSLVSRLYDDPFQSVENRMNQFVRGILDYGGLESTLGNYPVDVEEDNDQITIDAELPGFKREEVEVNVENGVLTIKAQRQMESNAGQGKKKHLSERRYNRVQRSFTLPRTVDGSNVDATLNDGVLTVVLKKSEESKPRRIEIR